MRRVVVIGTSGCGKSTLARAIAARLGVPHVELDAFQHGPNWTERPLDEFRGRVAESVEQDGWVVDGNYAKSRDLVWPRADTLIWLDYSMTVTFYRVFRRTMMRSISGEELWSGNRESLWLQFLSKDSLLLWVINTWRRHRREYPKMLRQPEHSHLKILRFRSPTETAAWLERITQS